MCAKIDPNTNFTIDVVSNGKTLQALILIYHLIFQVPVNTQQKVAYAILARVNQVSFCEFLSGFLNLNLRNSTSSKWNYAYSIHHNFFFKFLHAGSMSFLLLIVILGKLFQIYEVNKRIPASFSWSKK